MITSTRSKEEYLLKDLKEDSLEKILIFAKGEVKLYLKELNKLMLSPSPYPLPSREGEILGVPCVCIRMNVRMHSYELRRVRVRGVVLL